VRKNVKLAYLVCLHVILGILLIKSNLGQQLLPEGALNFSQRELTDHYHRMLRFHKRMDGNILDGSAIFIGDSLTQGLNVSSIAMPAVNYGIGGDTTFGVLQRLTNYQSLSKASVIIVTIGINDFNLRSNTEMLENYKQIFQRLPANVPVIINALLPVNENGHHWLKGFNHRIIALNMQLQALTSHYNNFVFLNISSHLVDPSGHLKPEFHSGDGLHLNSKANAVWIHLLREKIIQVKNMKASIKNESQVQ